MDEKLAELMKSHGCNMRVNISLNPVTLAKMDAAAGKLNMTRSAYIAFCTEVVQELLPEDVEACNGSV